MPDRRARTSTKSTSDTRWLALLVPFCLLACSEALLTFPLEAQRYDQARDCLGEEGIIDVIEGEAEGTCTGVICLESGESQELFVSTICEAPPGYAQLAAEDPVCALALAAHDQNKACPE